MALAARLGKGEVEITYECDRTALDDNHWDMWNALVHAVRNAVDHGLETQAERVAAGKPGAGAICLRARAQAGLMVVEVQDNGRGIPWQKVGDRLRAMGHDPKSHEDLVDGLFLDGLSTAHAVTDTSGRGVGMSALRAAVQRLHGKIEVESTAGQGTLVRCTVPTAVRAVRTAPPSVLRANG
jgi:two-component system chemotaxis sensor kinase CheA